MGTGGARGFINSFEWARRGYERGRPKEDPYRTRFGETLEKPWSDCPTAMWQYAAQDAIVTRFIFQELRERSRRLVRQRRIPSETLQQFGPLTIRVQVKAAVALRQMEINGIYIDQARRDSSKVDLEGRFGQLIESLERSEDFAPVFKRDKKGHLLRTATGSPSKSVAALQGLLARVADQHGISLEHTKSGQVSTSRGFWEQHANVESFLVDWIEAEKIAKLLQFFDKLQRRKIHLGYGTLVRTGRTSSKNPNLQQIPSEGSIRHMFVPRRGRVFVIADYSTLELRTLAAHCEQVVGYSVMADQIRAGRDLHGYTASLITDMEYGEFMSLKEVEPALYKQKRQAAKALNFGFPGGLGAKTFVQFAKNNYGMDITEREANEFRELFLYEIYPEVGEYMNSDLALTVACNLGCKPNEVRVHFRNDAFLGACRRVVRGEPYKRDGTMYDTRFVDRCWQSLADLNRREQLINDLEDRQAGDSLEIRLFFSYVVAPAGFVRGQTNFCQTMNTPFQSAAATGGKIAVWNLFRAGYRLRGYIHDEFIVEIAADADFKYHCQRIDRIMCESMQQVTGRVPVATEYAVASCWSKSAELVVESGGNYGVWHPN